MKFNAKEWENVKESGDFERLPAGAYVVKITRVEDVADKEYLSIIYDILEGEYAGYYADDFYADKDYAHRLIRSYKESARGMFKKFYLDLEKSNNGYTFDGDENKMVGKIIGILLGEEEYIANDGDIKTRLYCKTTTTPDKVRAGDIKVPALKRLPAEEKSDTFEEVNVDIPF